MPKKSWLIVCFLFIGFATQAQCAMCRAVLESEDGGNQAQAVNDGIVWLMIFPYILVGLAFYGVYKLKFSKKSH